MDSIVRCVLNKITLKSFHFESIFKDGATSQSWVREGWVVVVESKKDQNMGDFEQSELPEGCRVHLFESEAELLS